MIPANPLVLETVRGLRAVGPAHVVYLEHLAVQALVLVLWWPKQSLTAVLDAHDGPDTLLAAIIALGITSAYQGLRNAAEELLLPGQHSILEWRLATDLSSGRILRGFLLAHGLQVLHGLALATPLLVLGWCVAGGEPVALAWCLAMIVVQALVYRLIAATTYLYVGHQGEVTFFGLRALFLGGFLGTWALLPEASQLVQSYRLLSGGAAPAPDAGAMTFLAIHGALLVVLAALFHRLLEARRPGRPG